MSSLEFHRWSTGGSGRGGAEPGLSGGRVPFADDQEPGARLFALQTVCRHTTRPMYSCWYVNASEYPCIVRFFRQDLM